jgi:DNA-directed RNA polymerase subunit RPC12/RpoP
MPLTIHCSMCGANIAPADQAIRRGVVTCEYCSTIQRISASGTRKTDRASAALTAPEGVQIVRGRQGSLTITGRRTRQGVVVNPPETKRGALIGLGIGAAITAVGALVSVPFMILFGWDMAGIIVPALILQFLPVTFIAAVIAIFVVAWRQQNLPPLELRDKTLFPKMYGSKPVAIGDIRQLYSTTTRVLVRRPDEYIAQYMVFALTNAGERIFLLGPLDSAESALYIEEQIEAELGIFELPVYGNPDLPKQEGAALPVSPLEAGLGGITCQSCGAEMAVTPAEKKRGFSACRHCGSLLLLYEPGSAKPILGIPDASGKDSQYTVAGNTAETIITSRRSAGPVLRISKGKIHILAPGAAQKAVDADKINRMNVKETGWTPTRELDAGGRAAGFEALQKAMAYSGEVDPLKVLIGANAGITYTLSAVLSNGEAIRLLADIHDIGEAFYLERHIEQAVIFTK